MFRSAIILLPRGTVFLNFVHFGRVVKVSLGYTNIGCRFSISTSSLKGAEKYDPRDSQGEDVPVKGDVEAVQQRRVLVI